MANKKEVTKTDVTEKVEKIEITKEQPQVMKKKEIDRKQMVRVKNVTSGTVVYKSQKSGLELILENNGDEEWIEVEELLTMKASKAVFLTKPWLIIEDADDVVEYLGLKQIYANMTYADDLESLFRLPIDEIKEKINIMPQGYKEIVGERARKMVEDETLYDTRVIKFLETTLGISLQ